MQYELPNGYLSASSIGTLLTCPRMFEFRYVQRIPTPPSIAQITGTALHRTFEEYYRTSMTSAQRYTPNQVRDLAATMLEETISTDECYMTADEQSSAMDNVQDLAASYVDNIAKDIVPLAVEEQHTWSARCGVPLLAYIDLRHRLPDGGEGIIDYKITSRKWTPDKLANSLQFSLYSMMTGIRDISVHNLVKAMPAKRASVAKPQDGVTDVAPNLRILRHTFDGSGNEHLEDIIESSARLITTGVFTPCSLDAWNCNPDWCGYWHLCRGKAQATMIDLAA